MKWLKKLLGIPEIECGQIWDACLDNPFDTKQVMVTDYKDGYVQYIYFGQGDQHFSSSERMFRYQFDLVKRGLE